MAQILIRQLDPEVKEALREHCGGSPANVAALVTRNVSDFVRTGVELVDPWST